jgi:hypothetical protein
VFFEIATTAKHGKNTAPISPMALEAVKRIGVLFVKINRLTADQRLDRRRAFSLPLVDEQQAWLQTERENMSRNCSVAEAIDYMLQR